MVQSSANVPPDTRSVSRHSITLYLCSMLGHWSVNESTNSANNESAQQNQLYIKGRWDYILLVTPHTRMQISVQHHGDIPIQIGSTYDRVNFFGFPGREKRKNEVRHQKQVENDII